MAGRLNLFKRKDKKGVFDKEDPAKLYDLLECLGEGTYGTVWTGTEKATGTTCAVKIVKIDDDLEEIEQEIMIMKESDSPYVVKFFGAYTAEKERIWMVMEHCIAGSINDLMYVCDVTLNVAEVRTTAAAIALGLKYLHKNLVIHRDIKAGNVLLTAEGYIRLADFGVSAKLKKASDRTTTAIGAPFWMAPEVISEVPYDGKADVWSLGITIIELVEGRPPNSHMNAMKALFIIPNQEPPRLKDARLPREMHDFVRSCLVKLPKKRLSSKQAIQHPFIRDEARNIEMNGGRSEIMSKLVSTSLRKIEKWRKDDDDEEEEEEETMMDETTMLPSEVATPVHDMHPPAPNHHSMAPSVTLTELLPERIPHGSPEPSVPGSPVPTPFLSPAGFLSPQPNSPFPPHNGLGSAKSVGSRQSFLNPSKDAKFRLSIKEDKRNISPLRDVRRTSAGAGAPDQNNPFGRGQQHNMSVEQLATALNADVPQDSSLAQAAVLTKEFISLLKNVYKRNPQLFGNKAPKDWSGMDITVALTKTLGNVVEDIEPLGSHHFTSGMLKGGLEEGEELEALEDMVHEKEEQALRDFMNPTARPFVLGVDGDRVPPPPPPPADDDDDLEI